MDDSKRITKEPIKRSGLVCNFCGATKEAHRYDGPRDQWIYPPNRCVISHEALATGKVWVLPLDRDERCMKPDHSGEDVPLKYTETNDVKQVIRTYLKELAPHGHPEYAKRVLDHLILHSNKNHDYAKGGDPLGNFNRVSNILDQYPNFPIGSNYGNAIVQMLKQIDALIWGLCQNTQHKVEGFSSRCDDIAVYADLIAIMIKEAKEKQIKNEEEAFEIGG